LKAAAVFYAPTDLVTLIRNEAWEQKEKNLSGTEVDDIIKPADTPWTRMLAYPEPDKMFSKFKQLLESSNKEDPDWNYVELAKKYSPITYASADCPPMIILHGGQDPLVPIEQSESLYKALVSAGKPIEKV
jgi:acetyl esterase/lipase